MIQRLSLLKFFARALAIIVQVHLGAQVFPKVHLLGYIKISSKNIKGDRAEAP